MKKYYKLLRVKHYLKNTLIFLPLLFSGNFFSSNLINCLLAFISFSLAASFVYIINDIRDVENDRKHEIKRNRPIASGQVSIKKAIIIAILLIGLSLLFNYLAGAKYIASWIYLIIYVVINIGYSLGLKNVPLLDIVILVSGFLIRVLYGSAVTDIEVSKWLYLTIMSLSFYFGFGKRRNEIIKQGNSSRKVLTYYNQSFLDKNMYLCLALTIIFYALWCIEPSIGNIYNKENTVWTVPLVMLIFMKYSLIIEGNSHGDPVDVILSDKTLIVLGFLYCLIVFFIIYGNIII